MSEGEFALAAPYLRHIAEQLRSMGASVEEWLGRSSLREAQLDDPSLVVTIATFQRLVIDSLEVAKEPALGLFVGQRLVASTHGVLGYAALSSATVRQALEVLERFASVRTTMLTITHAHHRGEVRVRFAPNEPLGDIERPVLEAVILSIKNVLDDLSRGGCRVERVVFPFEAPDYASLARELFRCDVRFGQTWAGLVIPESALDLSLRLADAETFREAAQLCQRELEKLSEKQTLSARVRRLLLEKQNGFPSLPITARLFHMTPRTLHRKLVQEGTSYRQLLEDVRRTLAIEHLRRGRMSIEAVAYTLGYTDLANFRRAFKRWERVAPSTFRSKIRRSTKTST